LTADGNVPPNLTAFPRTIESGEVRTWQVRTPLDGDFLAAVRTDPIPPLESLGDLVAGLEVLELEFEWTYRRGRVFGTGTTIEHGATSVAIPANQVREVVAGFWESDGQAELAERARRR